MMENLQTPIRIRKFAKPKPLQRKSPQQNDQEMPVTPIQTSPNDLSPQSNQPAPSNPARAPKTPNPQSTAENLKKIYANPANAASYSGDVHAIANQIESYRYTLYC